MKITIYILIFQLIFLFSCGQKVSDSPRGCVTAFILSVEQHDINKSWECLSSEAKTFYNDLGEKMRKSGKGALENEINKIKTFRNAQKDYSIRKDKNSENILHLYTSGGLEFVIEMIDEDGAYKIKNGNSVRAILNVISGDIVNQNPY